MNAPRPVTTQIKRLNPILLSGDMEKINEYLDMKIREEEEVLACAHFEGLTDADIDHLAAIDAERVTEAQRPQHKFNYRNLE